MCQLKRKYPGQSTAEAAHPLSSNVDIALQPVEFLPLILWRGGDFSVWVRLVPGYPGAWSGFGVTFS